jgi:hypothetical protein
MTTWWRLVIAQRGWIFTAMLVLTERGESLRGYWKTELPSSEVAGPAFTAVRSTSVA